MVPFSRAYEALVFHPRLAEVWPDYLILQHQIIRATVPLTEAALARARSLGKSDRLAALAAMPGVFPSQRHGNPRTAGFNGVYYRTDANVAGQYVIGGGSQPAGTVS